MELESSALIYRPHQRVFSTSRAVSVNGSSCHEKHCAIPTFIEPIFLPFLGATTHVNLPKFSFPPHNLAIKNLDLNLYENEKFSRWEKMEIHRGRAIKSQPKGSVRPEIPWIRTFRTQKTKMISHISSECFMFVGYLFRSIVSKEQLKPRKPRKFPNIQMEIVLESLRLLRNERKYFYSTFIVPSMFLCTSYDSSFLILVAKN